MNVPFWLSKKLKLNGSRKGANATGVVIAVTGVAIAIVVMELTIAIVLGFKHSITERIEGFDGEIWIQPNYQYNDASAASDVSAEPALTSLVRTIVPDATFTLRYDLPGILKTENDFTGVYFTGYDNTHDTGFEKSQIIKGEFPDFDNPENANRIVISSSTASALGLDLGEKINACFFANEAIKARKFEIAGIYESGFGDFDRTIAFAPISTLQKISGIDSLAGTRLYVNSNYDSDEIENIANDLQTALIDEYKAEKIDKLYPVDNVKRTGAVYYNWLNLLDTNVVVIFILMICVSGFTLVSSMFILILERIPTIGILRALGARKRQIRLTFVFMTMKIVGLGILIGNVLGILLMWLQHTYNIITLDPEMYYLRYVPVEFNWPYFALLNVGVILAAWLILILPSRVASGISPAVTMRFE